MQLAHSLVLAGFAACLLAAATSDVRHLRIPNWVSVTILLLFPLHAMTAAVPVAFWSGLIVAAAMLLGGFCLFALRAMGAGDAKLLAAVGLWAGQEFGAELVLLTALVGGILGLALLTPLGGAALSALQAPGAGEFGAGDLGGNAPAAPFDARVSRRPMPYGIAIAAAGLVLAAHLALTT